MSSQHADRLSIAAIVPLYNGAPFIGEALESILSQSRPADEIIVVDDGSSDDGPDVARKFGPAVTVLHKENGGQSSARNFGVRHSTSELIAFLDQDDLWHPEHLSTLERPFLRRANHNLGWVYNDLDEIDEHGNMVTRRLLSTLQRQHHPKRSIFECLQEDMYILPSAALISRKAFEAVGGFDERLSGYEDDDLFLRIFRARYDNVFVPRALSSWRIHANSASYSHRMAQSRRIYLQKLLAGFPDDHQLNRYYARDYIAPRFLRAALWQYGEGIRKKDKAVFFGAIEDILTLKPYLGIKHRLFLSVITPFLPYWLIAAPLYRSKRFITPIIRAATGV